MNYLTKKSGMCIIYSVGYTPCASIAQSVEHFTRNEGVPSSNLGFGSNNQEITVFVISFFVPFGEGKEG